MEQQYSHWTGFDLTTNTGTENLKGHLLEKRPRNVWMAHLLIPHNAHNDLSQDQSSIEKQVNILSVFLWPIEQDWCDTILEQMWGSTSLGRGGVLSDLKERCLCSKSWPTTSSCHAHQTLEKETLQYTPQLVKTIVIEIIKVESSKQIHSLACCSMTVDSKSQTQHQVAPAISCTSSRPLRRRQ